MLFTGVWCMDRTKQRVRCSGTHDLPPGHHVSSNVHGASIHVQRRCVYVHVHTIVCTVCTGHVHVHAQYRTSASYSGGPGQVTDAEQVPTAETVDGSPPTPAASDHGHHRLAEQLMGPKADNRRIALPCCRTKNRSRNVMYATMP
jgi:hypothetical protein